MKKTSILIAALFAVAMMFVGAGCSDGDKNELQGMKNEILGIVAPSNTWCSKDITYSKADDASKSAALHVSFYYTDTAIPKGTGDEGPKEAIPAGITILITLKDGGSNNLITSLTKSTYIMKSFPKDSDTALDGDSSSTFKGTFEKWAAIYRLSTDLQTNKSTTTPGALRNDTNYTGLNWDEIKENFSWKRLLVNYLSAQL